MRKLWVLTLAVVALAALPGCKRKEPIPGPKAAGVSIPEIRLPTPAPTPGIAWFQESLDEAFSRAPPAPKPPPRRELQCDAPVRPVFHRGKA